MSFETIKALASSSPPACLTHLSLVWEALQETERSHLVAGLSLFEKSPTIAEPAATIASSTPSEFSLVTMPNVSFLNPRGLFSVDFGQGFIELRPKKGVAIRIDDLGGIDLLEKESSNALILLISSAVFLINLKGLNSKANAATPLSSTTLPPHVLTLLGNDKVARYEVFFSLLAFSFPTVQVPLSVSALVTSAISKKNYVQCHSKSVNEGRLFPLERGLVFTGSGPFIFLSKDCTQVVSFNRSNSRMFELTLKTGGGEVIVFSSIPADDVPCLQAYFNSVVFKREEELKQPKKEEDDDNEEEEDDDSKDDDEVSLSSDDSVFDPNQDEYDEEENMRAVVAGSDEEEVDEDDEDDDEVLKENFDDVAEVVEEDSFHVDLEDIIPQGRKRQRKLLPNPE